MKTLSIVIPVLNEERHIKELCGRLLAVIKELAYEVEVIFVDDGSKDNTFEEIRKIFREQPRFRGIRFKKNFGKSSALAAGFEFAKGEVLLLMDGDLQHRPEEIPAFLKKIEEGYDAVIGWREKRVDDFLTRRLPSLVANKMIAFISGVKLHDFGGTFHAYRRDVLDGIELYPNLHRFIPVLMSLSGNYNIIEIPITNAPRKYGKSNYGLLRIFDVLFSVLTVKYLISYALQPLRLFGSLGLILILLGGSVNLYLLAGKLFANAPILSAHGPLFLSALFAMLGGLQLMMAGVLGEILTRIYYRATQRKIYALGEKLGFD